MIYPIPRLYVNSNPVVLARTIESNIMYIM